MLWLSKSNKHAFTVEDLTNTDFKAGNKDVLLDISHSLVPESYEIRNIRSIPDIFSKARMFDMSIRLGESSANTDNFFKSYKEWVEYEWRAMIATLVLSDNLNLRVKKIPFFPDIDDETNPIKQAYLKTGKDDNDNQVLSPLESIILKRLPSSNLWTDIGNYDESQKIDFDLKQSCIWSRGYVYVLCLDNAREVSIAISSPTTLIVPAIDAWDILWDNFKNVIPWIEPFASSSRIDQKKLQEFDPARIIAKECSAHLPILYSWLELYRKEIIKMSENRKWCDNPDKTAYLCGPVGNITQPGIFQRFENDLNKNGHISNDVRATFDQQKIKTIKAPYIPSDETQISMDTPIQNKICLFVDCTEPNTAYNDLDSIKGIDRLSLKTLINERKLERSNLEARNQNLDIPEYKSPILDRLRKRGVELYFSDDLFLPQAVCAGYDYDSKQNQNLFTDAVNPRVVSFYPGKDTGYSKKYLTAIPFTEDGFNFCKNFPNVKYNITAKPGEIHQEDIAITITLDIPMKQGSAGTSHSSGLDWYTFTKTYSNSHESQNTVPEITVINKHDMCITGIWPSAPVAHWRSYYLFCLQQSPFYIAPLDSSTIVDSLNYNFHENAHSSPHTDFFKARYTGLKEFPEFTVLMYNNKVLGYIPLNTINELTAAKASQYNVSVDFGTSSTAIARQFNNEDKQLFDFKNLGSGGIFFNPLYRRDTGAREDDYFIQYFIPHNDTLPKVPFQSLLHDYIGDKENQLRRHILNSTIFYKLNSPGQVNPIEKHLDSDLKWSVEESKNARVSVYFRQISRMVILDAVLRSANTVKVFLSYPSAKADLSLQCDKLIEEFEYTNREDVEHTGNPPKSVITIEKEDYITEGLAAAKFFQSESNVNFRTVIDIGAGTTDYFMYHLSNDNRIQYETQDSSVKFGARELFVALLLQDAKKHRGQLAENSLLYKILNSQVTVSTDAGIKSLAEFFKKSKFVQSIRSNSEGTGPELLDKIRIITEFDSEHEFCTEVETILSLPLTDNPSFGETAERTVGDIIHKAITEKPAPEILEKKFLTILAFGVASVVYYTGIMSRKLKSNIDNFGVDLKFTGNGSKILNWLKPYNNENFLKDFITYIFFSAYLFSDFSKDKFADKQYALNFGLSDKPKLEAAFGMLSGANIWRQENEDKINTIILAGENFQNFNGKEYTAIDCLAPETIFTVEDTVRKINIPNNKIDHSEFDHFCNSFNNAILATYGISKQAIMLPIDYNLDKSTNFGQFLYRIDTPDFLNNRNSNIDNFLRSYTEDKKSEVELTPFFFIETKEMINSLRKKFDGNYYQTGSDK